MRPQLEYNIKIQKSYDWLEWQDFSSAIKVLNGVAFKMYVYFCSFQPDAFITYTPGEFVRLSNSSRSAERTAFAELITQGYLRQNGNEWIFAPFKN